MILGLEIGMLIGGLIVLLVGKVPFSRNGVIKGGAARVAGFVMLLPVPLSFSAGYALGWAAMADGRRIDLEQGQGYLTAIEITSTLGCLVLALLILLAAEPARPKQPARRNAGAAAGDSARVVATPAVEEKVDEQRPNGCPKASYESLLRSLPRWPGSGVE